MDPKACLLRFMSAVSDEHFSEACDAMNAYYQWRVKGGFEPELSGKDFPGLPEDWPTGWSKPMRGDYLADWLCNRMIDAMTSAE